MGEGQDMLPLEGASREELARRARERTAELEQVNAALQREIAEREAAQRELFGKTEHLQTLLETSHDAILVVDAEGKFEYGNPAFFRTFGWPPEEIIGHFFMKVVAPELHDFMLERWAEVQAGKGAPYETVIMHKSGERRALLVMHRHMTIAGERKYCVVVKDISERKRVEEELLRHREALEQLVAERTAELRTANERLRETIAESERIRGALARAQETAHIGSWTWHVAEGRAEWSDEMYRLYRLDSGAPPPPIEWLRNACIPEDLTLTEAAMNACIQHGVPIDCEHRIRLANGDIRYVLIRGRRRCGTGAGNAVVEGTMLDITQRRELEREVVEASRLTQERIGADIHDVLGQELAGLSMLLSAFRRRVESLAPELNPQATEISQLASRALKHTRALAHGLSPVDIAKGGLTVELPRLARHMESDYGVSCSFTLRGEGDVHTHANATHLYHIAQEACRNAVRHGRAGRIEIQLDTGDSGLLQVRDNGQWLDQPDQHRGVGLRIMQHRAEIIGASLTVSHGSGQETVVTCTFPNLPDGAPPPPTGPTGMEW